jgi:hypothetical protein
MDARHVWNPQQFYEDWNIGSMQFERYTPMWMYMRLPSGGIPAMMRKYELQALSEGGPWTDQQDPLAMYHPLIPYADVCSPSTHHWEPPLPPL